MEDNKNKSNVQKLDSLSTLTNVLGIFFLIGAAIFLLCGLVSVMSKEANHSYYYHEEYYYIYYFSASIGLFSFGLSNYIISSILSAFSEISLHLKNIDEKFEKNTDNKE